MAISQTNRPDLARTLKGPIERWAESLIDRSGRNEMLFCKDRAKLLLDGAPPEAVDRVLRGKTVRLRDLFPVEQDHRNAVRTGESIRKRIKEYHEERGLRVGRLAYAFASWRDAKDRTVRAPVLLREVTVQRSAMGFGDHEITADPDLEINPVLVTYLESTFKVSLPRDLLDELNDQVDNPDQVEPALDRLRQAYAQVPDFQVTAGMLVGTFHYAKLAMYEDLMNNAAVHAMSALFAAIAGDQQAIAAVRKSVGDVTRDQPDRTPPEDEFLVLDADPSQNYAINAALSGRNLVVQGPPGTGKSQTISNLISTLTARGQRVLFVAEKRAAIDAVLGRLQQAGLGPVVLDLHLTTANRAAVYRQFLEAIQGARQVASVDRRHEQSKLVRARQTMIRHAEAMHTPISPWETTAFDAQAALIGTPVQARTPARISAQQLSRLSRDRLDEIREALGALVDMNGILPAERRGPWGTATLTTQEQATRARDVVRSLRLALDDLVVKVSALATQAGRPAPSTPTQAGDLVQRCNRAMAVVQGWHPDVFGQDIARLLAATGDASYRRSAGVAVGFWERRRLKKVANGLRRGPGQGGIHVDLVELASVMAEWEQLTGRRQLPPVNPQSADAATSAYLSNLTELSNVFGGSALRDMPWKDLAAGLDSLAADALGPSRVVEVLRLHTMLRDAGLDEFLVWLVRTAPQWSPDDRRPYATASLDFAWYGSILDEARAHNAALATFDGRNQSAVAAEFARSDQEHIRGTGQRILRIAAERLTATRSAHPEQDLFLDKELTRKRKLKTMRELMDKAPDVLLAAKPCWAMSPLMVSQMLPPGQLFDVVVFDEASQVQPAEAMPSLARAHRAVIAGDSKQLPPTSFFEERTEESDEDIEEEDEALTTDVESILEAFNRALGQSIAHEYYLGWHYRSEDARLIAFSNAEFYDNRLVAFPGTAVDPPLVFVEVDGAAVGGSGAVVGGGVTRPTSTSDEATGPEVDRVVDLALDQARERPDESLGVIAFSIKHATRIESALFRRLRDEPELREFFDEGRPDAFFVKNLERVQGDERDAIILSAGFAKVDGRLYRRFGPLNLAGGERRLNVAITRARRRLTLVTSFSPDDLDPSSLTATGAKSMAKFVRFAAHGGLDVDGALQRTALLNPFEISVRDRLVQAGIDVACQWGVAGYFIDFVVRHPNRPDRMILAIEADGAAYHSGETARARDRLRQEHLERLGWRFHRIWSTDWFTNPDGEMAKVRQAYAEAVAHADTVRPRPIAPIAPPPTVKSAPAARSPVRSGPAPRIYAGTPIGQYSDAQLGEIVRWIVSDGALRTDEEIIREAAKELGFARLGSQIRARLGTVIRQSRNR